MCVCVVDVASEELKKKYLNRIMISNVHIHWDPEFCDVKLMQILLFLTELRRKISDDIPLVLTGDFNSLPSSGNPHDSISWWMINLLWNSYARIQI